MSREQSKYFEQENLHLLTTTLVLALLALGLVLGGSRLLAIATTPSVIYKGFGFIYSFFGYHVIALGHLLLFSSLLSLALASLQRYYLNKATTSASIPLDL